MSEIVIMRDEIIHKEMMSHPALFTHPHPKTAAVIGDDSGSILQEVLKHQNMTHVWQVSNKMQHAIDDKRVTVFTGTAAEWLNTIEMESLDIIINTQTVDASSLAAFYKALPASGMLVQQSDSPFDLKKLKALQAELLASGFSDIHFLSFSQPQFPSGWRTAVMAQKQGNFRRIREKDIFNKTFTTRYYNFDIHKASLVLPEFMREELENIQE